MISFQKVLVEGSVKMRALGTFLLFLLGLVTGGFTGYFFANFGGATPQAIAGLEQTIEQLADELNETRSALDTSEMLVEGSTDVLASYKQQIDRLQERVDTAERVANDAQQAANVNQLAQNSSDGSASIANNAGLTAGPDSQALAAAQARINNLEALLAAQSRPGLSEQRIEALESQLGQVQFERDNLLAQLSELQLLLNEQAN